MRGSIEEAGSHKNGGGKGPRLESHRARGSSPHPPLGNYTKVYADQMSRSSYSNTPESSRREPSGMEGEERSTKRKPKVNCSYPIHYSERLSGRGSMRRLSPLLCVDISTQERKSLSGNTIVKNNGRVEGGQRELDWMSALLGGKVQCLPGKLGETSK